MSSYKLKNYNIILALCVVALNVLGIMIIHSATGGNMSIVERQIVGVCVGIVVMGIISFIPYRMILKVSAAAYIGCCALLLMVLVIGLVRGGARRWVTLPVIGQFQPSEITKIGMILVFADYLGRNEGKINTGRVLIPALAIAALPLLLVFAEPDLSTTIIMAVMLVSMLFVAGISYKTIGTVLIIAVPLTVVMVLLLRSGKISFLNDYQANRILAFFDKSAYVDQNIQQDNSIMAIASGKLWGKGLNNDSLQSIKNGNFLSEQRTDFIFAVIGEELGFAGTAGVILVYALIVFQCFHMAGKCEDMAGKLICTGMGALVGFQSFTNIAVNIGLFPNTGLPLPFISYGVSSLLSMYIGMGFALNVGLSGNENKTRRYL